MDLLVKLFGSFLLVYGGASSVLDVINLENHNIGSQLSAVLGLILHTGLVFIGLNILGIIH